MTQIKEQFGVLILVFVLAILLAYSWVFRADHDVMMAANQWIAGVIGGILGLVTGKASTAAQQNRISNSTVSAVVEDKAVSGVEPK